MRIARCKTVTIRGRVECIDGEPFQEIPSLGSRMAWWARSEDERGDLGPHESRREAFADARFHDWPEAFGLKNRLSHGVLVFFDGGIFVFTTLLEIFPELRILPKLWKEALVLLAIFALALVFGG